MSGSRPRPYLGPVIALLVVLALGAGTVYAAIPNGNGKYYACRVSNTGVVKLINYPKVSTCPKGEKLISWNAKGPQGPAGSAGGTGPQGPAGPADWNAIANKPAGFADGVDNEGVTAVKIATVSSTTPGIITPAAAASDSADCPTGFLPVGGGFRLAGIAFADIAAVSVYYSQAIDVDTWAVAGYKPAGGGNVEIYAQVHCLRAEPAGLTVAAKNSNYGPKKVKLLRPDK